MSGKRSVFILSALIFGFAFLYVPIISMVVFSFNASKLVTVWDAYNSPTLKWCVSMFANTQLLGSRAWCSRASAASRGARCSRA